MDKKIVWYSDFDGVFNLSSSTDTTVTKDIVTRDSRYLRKHKKITWEPEVIEWVRELMNTGLFDFIWHTTWNDASNICQASKIMGLGELQEHTIPVFDEKALTKKDWTAWKAQTIVKDQAVKPSPFIWIDDESPDHWEDYVRGHTKSPSLIIKINSQTGLTKDNIVSIIDFTQQNI